MDVRVGPKRRLSAKESMLWCSKEILESPLDCCEIQPVHPEGNQSWVFIERTDAEAETPILWPPDEKSWLIWKYPDAQKDWKWEEKGMTEDEMIGWHHRLNRYEYEQTLGDSEWQGKPVLLQFMGSQRVGHNSVTEQQCSSEYEFKRFNQVLSVVLDTQ